MIHINPNEQQIPGEVSFMTCLFSPSIHRLPCGESKKILKKIYWRVLRILRNFVSFQLVSSSFGIFDGLSVSKTEANWKLKTGLITSEARRGLWRTGMRNLTFQGMMIHRGGGRRLHPTIVITKHWNLPSSNL